MVLSKLLYRKWFTRVWVLQELAAASAAGVVCGNAFSECVYETLPMLAIPFRDFWIPIFGHADILKPQVAGQWRHAIAAGQQHALVVSLGSSKAQQISQIHY